eukprot:15365257-Ditylum_brightwellii.AAC.1
MERVEEIIKGYCNSGTQRSICKLTSSYHCTAPPSSSASSTRIEPSLKISPQEHLHPPNSAAQPTGPTYPLNSCTMYVRIIDKLLQYMCMSVLIHLMV